LWDVRHCCRLSAKHKKESTPHPSFNLRAYQVFIQCNLNNLTFLRQIMAGARLLVGNWKMNLGLSKAQELATQFLPLSKNLKRSEIWFTPPFTSIGVVAQAIKGSSVRLGAQNVHWAENGAFTGEVSVGMLRECGCSYALTGHSERRHVFGETSELVAKRTLGALKTGFTVILCIGEKLEEREQGRTLDVIKAQLAPVLKELTPDLSHNLVLAYEPVWAIGTGKVASVNDIEETHRGIVAHWEKSTSGGCPPILYGGSVDPDNVGAILKIDAVGGCLIGGASIHVEKFPKIVTIAEQA
jgi:triosephosphate isomerase (TIM)